MQKPYRSNSSLCEAEKDLAFKKVFLYSSMAFSRKKHGLRAEGSG
jgi:hypothetical protein